MKKHLVKLAAACMVVVVALTACGGGAASTASKATGGGNPKPLTGGDSVSFTIPNYGIKLNLPKDYSRDTDTDFDAYFNNKNEELGITAYEYADLAASETPKDIYQWEVDGMATVVENMKKIGTPKTFTYDDKVITGELYSGTRDKYNFDYYYMLVDFKGCKKFAWVMFACDQGKASEFTSKWESIAASMTCDK